MIGNLLSTNSTDIDSGLRPVNIRTDLAQLADLMEVSFSKTMDTNGRAAIREWRYMSSMGLFLSFLGSMNEAAFGIGQGYVWVEDKRIVGNSSIYPANWPRELGEAWLIANVGVHPDYQRRGIARQLMQASMDMIRRKGGQHAILQVDYDNDAAINLYDSLGFRRERAFTTWWRSAITPSPTPLDNNVFISHPRLSDWQTEYNLVETLRPNKKGGIGWLKPTHQGLIKPTLLGRIGRLFSLSSVERMIVRADDDNLAATVWIDNGFATASTRIVLMAHPDYSPIYPEALLNNVLRRFRSTSISIDHPHDDGVVSEILDNYRFRPNRTLWHMRAKL